MVRRRLRRGRRSILMSEVADAYTVTKTSSRSGGDRLGAPRPRSHHRPGRRPARGKRQPRAGRKSAGSRGEYYGSDDLQNSHLAQPLCSSPETYQRKRSVLKAGGNAIGPHTKTSAKGFAGGRDWGFGMQPMSGQQRTQQAGQRTACQRGQLTCVPWMG